MSDGAPKVGKPNALICDTDIRKFDPTTEAKWDDDLAACPQATFFHGASWARVLKSSYGFKPVYFAVRDSGGTRALLPLMEIASPLTGRRGVALPFTDECLPLCSNGEQFAELFRQALAHSRSNHLKYLELRGGLNVCRGAKASTSFFGHSLDLRAGEKLLFDGCDSSVRRAVRKAEQSGLAIEFATSLDAVRIFYKLLCKTRRRHGVPPQPFAFFSAIQEHVLSRGQGWVVIARAGDIPVAGAIYLHFQKKVIYKFGASDESFNHLRANNFVMWEAIKRHWKDGFENLDFGRSSLTNVGLQKFKLSWGTSSRVIDYMRYDLRSGGFVVVNDTATGLSTRLLRLLPEPLLNFLGSSLYRHLA